MVNKRIEPLRVVISLLLLIFTCRCNADDNLHRHFEIVKVVGSYKRLVSTREFPHTVISRLSNQFKECPGIADPENEFNPGCAFGIGGLPCQKMIYGGNFGDIWFMEHLEGGSGVWQTFRAFRVENNRVVSLFIYQRVNGGQKVITTEDLINTLSKTPDCTSVSRGGVQDREEIKFGICTPPEDSSLRSLTPQ